MCISETASERKLSSQKYVDAKIKNFTKRIGQVRLDVDMEIQDQK